MVRADHDAGPPEVAAALAEVGQQALWAREFALAVARYTEALEVKPDEGADSMRSLADALLSDAWTQPMEKADSVLKALQLCQDAASLSPVDASTAWSLEVEHKAHGLLAGLERPDRVEHLWLAASASARSVAFDPASADRWTWLGYRLTSLGAYHRADLAARRAVALGDDSIDTRDLRAVTALNLWQPETAATFLAARESASDDDKAWVAALNAMTYRARRDAAQAATKMKDAVDLEPSEVLYRRWRAELLSIAGDPQATTEWRQIWRDADLETLDGLYAATLAATHQGLLASAKELAERLNSTQVMTAGDRTGLLVRGLTRLADRDEQGWADIRETLDWEIVAESVQEVGQSVGAMLRSSGLAQVAEAPRRVAALVDDRVAQIRATLPNGDGEGRASADAELVWFRAHAAGQQLEDVVKDAAEAVRVAFDLPVPAPQGSPEADGSGATDGSADVVGSGDQESTDVPEAPVLYLGVPRKWFEGYEGRELTHDIFTRALPDARAWARRVRPLVNQWPSVQVWPDDSGSDSVVTQTTDGAQTAFLVHRPAWYCPPNWLAALPAERREKATPNPSTGFYVLPGPTTPIEQLTCWTAEDVAARLTLLAEAAVAEKVTREEPHLSNGSGESG
jgi:tetratricopeptide (TPR) repeat protein